jgi:hypothetical protein
VEDLYGSHVEQEVGKVREDRTSTLKFALHTNEAKDGGANVIIEFDALRGGEVEQLELHLSELIDAVTKINRQYKIVSPPGYP